MKTLVVTRLFSGFETSLATGRWRPTGAPTIFKIIEALDRAGELHVVLACKDGMVDWPHRQDVALSVDALRARITVLAGHAAFPARFGRARSWLRDLRQILRLFAIARREQPDLLYIDHANVWAAGILARTLNVPVVFRVMGVYPVMRAALTARRPALRALRWCYRAPYAAVVCTQDGSGSERWLERALRPGVPRALLVNGVDPLAPAERTDERIKALPAGRTVVMFLGKLEPEKAPEPFVAGFLQAWRREPGLFALIVGTGRRMAAIRQAIADAGAEDDVAIIDRLPHAQVAAAVARADIYVSLNRLGNLSTANLEVMSQGRAMIFPRSQPESGVDLVTDALVPHDAAVRIAGADDVSGLADALVRLHRDPAERARLAEAMARAARAFIPDWQTRVAREMALLSCVAEHRPVETNLAEGVHRG